MGTDSLLPEGRELRSPGFREVPLCPDPSQQCGFLFFCFGLCHCPKADVRHIILKVSKSLVTMTTINSH